MAILSKIINDLKIKSLSDLNQVIKSEKAGSLRIVKIQGTKTDLIDYEVINNEIHGELIEFTNMILDFTQLSIFPKLGIAFRNCIFTGKIKINGNVSNGSSKIEMENCIFLDELIISGFSENLNNEIFIFHTNVAFLSMFNIKASGIVLTSCKIFFLALHKIDAVKFDAENNYFKNFEIESSKFEEGIFDHRQFDISNMGKRIMKNISKSEFETFSKMNMDINLFLFIPYKTSADIQKSESYNTMMETIDFLKASTSLRSDRNKYTQLMFFEVLLTQDNLIHKLFVWITGGFLKPFRFIFMATTILLLFSIVYMLPMLEFNSARDGLIHSLPFDQALYFSGVTFTTIGYGDICPVGFSRLFAILEGILGISTMSGFLVALVKKYID